MNQIKIENIRGKDRVRGGQKLPGQVAEGQNALVTPGKEIALYGVNTNVAPGKPAELYEKVFKLGDTAEYDSYNLSYLGKIVAISDKRVVIQENHSERKHSLDLYTFNWRNKNFDLEKTLRDNEETSRGL